MPQLKKSKLILAVLKMKMLLKSQMLKEKLKLKMILLQTSNLKTTKIESKRKTYEEVYIVSDSF
jgi:hypothetical protein